MSEHPIQPELLDAFLDGELDPEGEQHLRRHLEQCEACRRYVEQVKNLKGAFSSMGRLSAPPELLSRIKEQAATRRRSWWLSGPFLAAVSVAAALVVVFAVAVYEGSRDVSFQTEVSFRAEPSPGYGFDKVAKTGGAAPEQEIRLKDTPGAGEKAQRKLEEEASVPNMPVEAERKRALRRAGARMEEPELAKAGRMEDLSAAPSSVEYSGSDEPPSSGSIAATASNAAEAGGTVALKSDREPKRRGMGGSPRQENLAVPAPPPEPRTKSLGVPASSPKPRATSAKEIAESNSVPQASVESAGVAGKELPPRTLPDAGAPPAALSGRAGDDRPSPAGRDAGDRQSSPAVPERRYKVLATLSATSAGDAAEIADRKACELGWSVSEARRINGSIFFVLVPLELQETDPEVQEGGQGETVPGRSRETAAEPQVVQQDAVAASRESVFGIASAGESEKADAEVSEEAEPSKSIGARKQDFAAEICVIEVRIVPPAGKAAKAKALEE